MVHVTLFQIFKEADINDMADMELRAFEARLDTMMDQLNEESTELIIERPRYAHAVMVFASGAEPGELLTASRIKMLDPIYVPIEAATNGHQKFHYYSENFTPPAKSMNDFNNCDEKEDFDLITTVGIYDDDDIQKALRKLEESRSMLDDESIITPSTTASHFCASPPFSRSIPDRCAALKEGAILFPSQRRQQRRASTSSTRTLL
uniref:Uncharacterized protein n=3 Tax=Wuchereria bancrofti TaxID=6293 RepID=A0AAF5PTH6_WUCBA